MRPPRLACLVALAALAACVPASEALPPAGAGGFATQPSPATRGEPFTTEDGWTVRIEKVALSCWITASPPFGSYSGRRYGSGGWLFDASQPVAVYAPEISVGPAIVDIALRGNYVYVGRDNSRDSRRILGVAPEVVERSNAPPDEGFEDAYFGDDLRYPAGDGPSVLLALRAERAGRVERMDLALGISAYPSSSGRRLAIDIFEDTVITRPVGVNVEELFRDSKGRLAFDEFAAADTDGDGVVTIAELKSARTTCKCPITAPAHPSGPRPVPDLVDLLELNAAKVLVPR